MNLKNNKIIPLLFLVFLTPLFCFAEQGQMIEERAFQAICDHIVDHQNKEAFNPEMVKLGDTIYLCGWDLPWFEQQIHDRIKFPYILITCDIGGSFPSPYTTNKLLYDPKLAAWFCKNIVFSYHPKFIQLPMGQHILYWGDVNLSRLEDLAAAPVLPKKHFLYMNHYPRDYGDRQTIIPLFENQPYCYSRNFSDKPYQIISRDLFHEELASSVFVISPPGLESDCARTWEAFLVDCIPIVEHGFFDPLYDDLPVLLIHQWNEINEEFLRRKYIEIKNRHLSKEKAFFPYWKNLIQEKQKQIRNWDTSSSSFEATLFSSEDLTNLCKILQQSGHTRLVYRSMFTFMHALQLAHAAPFIQEIELYDPWMNPCRFEALPSYLNAGTKQLFYENQHKINVQNVLTSWYIDAGWLGRKECAIFLDLTYHRSSLLIHGLYDLQFLKPMRHSLQAELHELYHSSSPDVFICGNMVHNDYVKESLIRFATANQLAIETQGDFWFLTRPLIAERPAATEEAPES